MILYFGLQYDDGLNSVLNYPAQGGILYLGPKSLLAFLECHLGLGGLTDNNEHLRIEQYRQVLLLHSNESTLFYSASFQADQLATSSTLLGLRDELLLAGWDFECNEGTPERLRILSEIEKLFQLKEHQLHLSPGFADRFKMVLKKIKTRKIPITKIYLNEPAHLLSSYLQELFDILSIKGVEIIASQEIGIDNDTDLAHLQRALLHEKLTNQKRSLKKDGSVIIIRCKRETDAAAWLAKLFRQNPDYQPTFVIPEKNRALENALIYEGLPSLGIPSASLARPSLQILKLVTTFLWRPIDPFKIMEFVSLSLKPLADDLAVLIARQMAETPGLNGEGWYIMKTRYFEELEVRAQLDSTINAEKIKFQYDFWFERTRYDADKRVPKEEVVKVFSYLTQWAKEEYNDSGSKNASLIVLQEQANRVVDLLDALPANETHLSMLELERIVRTIYEPSPVVFKEKEVGHFDYVYHSSCLNAPADRLIWWNFIQNERDHFFSKWYKNEFDYLGSKDITLQDPRTENALLLWQRPRAVLRTKKQVVFVAPEMVDGSEVFKHPLHDEMDALFEEVEKMTFNLEKNEDKSMLEALFKLPQRISLDPKHSKQPAPFLSINFPEKLQQNPEETFSSLNMLFYYPYQWVFKHKIKLRKLSILSVVNDVTLMGNLSHRLFEKMFREDNIQSWDKQQVENWIDQQSKRLLSREGAVLLMYGREPEKVAFLNRVKFAAWSLVSHIRSNGWKVWKTEMPLAGKFCNIPIKGKADLVLVKDEEFVVIDLKWRGATRRRNMIKNEEDLQLVTYSKLLTDDERNTYAAYFILESGQIIARNNLAFKEAESIAPDEDHNEINDRIYRRMLNTYNWRMQQFQNGKIEIRNKWTLQDLELEYGDELMEVLEMKQEDAPFDDYKTLILGRQS